MSEETTDVKIALLRSDVNAQIDFAKNVEKSLEKIISVANDMGKLLSDHAARLSAAETTMKANAVNTAKSEETLVEMREQLMQMKIDNHIERETNHREVMKAIASGNTKLSEEIDRKVKDLDVRMDHEVDSLNKQIQSLTQFKYLALGMGSMMTVEMILRIMGVT